MGPRTSVLQSHDVLAAVYWPAMAVHLPGLQLAVTPGWRPALMATHLPVRPL